MKNKCTSRCCLSQTYHTFTVFCVALLCFALLFFDRWAEEETDNNETSAATNCFLYMKCMIFYYKNSSNRIESIKKPIIYHGGDDRFFLRVAILPSKVAIVLSLSMKADDDDDDDDDTTRRMSVSLNYQWSYNFTGPVQRAFRSASAFFLFSHRVLPSTLRLPRRTTVHRFKRKK